MNHRPVRLALSLALVVISLGCGSMIADLKARADAGGAKGGSKAAVEPGYRGTVKFANSSALRVWAIEAIMGKKQYVRVDKELAPGASTTFEAPELLVYFFVTECGSARMLFGRSPNEKPLPARLHDLKHGAIALYDAGAAPAAPTDHHATAASPQDMADWHTKLWTIWVSGARDTLNEKALRDEALAALRAFFKSRNSVGVALTLRIISADWDINRYKATKVIMSRSFQSSIIERMPDGHCQALGATFWQVYDGTNYSKVLQSDGASMNVLVPCTAADWAATQVAWAHGRLHLRTDGCLGALTQVATLATACARSALRRWPRPWPAAPTG